MEPIVDELEKELAGRVEFEKVDVDSNQELAAKHQVMSIPTYIIQKDDAEQERIIGAITKENFLKTLAKYG